MFISEFISLQVSPSDRASELGFGLRKSPFLKSAPSHGAASFVKEIFARGGPQKMPGSEGREGRETRTNTNRRTLRRRSAWETTSCRRRSSAMPGDIQAEPLKICLRRKISLCGAKDISRLSTICRYPASAAGVGIKGGVGGESVSCTSTAIGSHVAGPITMKLSGIDQGNSVSVLGRVRGRMIQDS